MSETAHKLKLLLEYWIDHNREHIRDNEKWLETVRAEGMEEIAHRFEHVIGDFHCLQGIFHGRRQLSGCILFLKDSVFDKIGMDSTLITASAR